MNIFAKKNLAIQIVQTLRKKGFEAFWAGGCVRDMVMGKDPNDFDIATSAKPEEVMHLFPKTVPVGVQFGVILVLLEGQEFEVATFRSDTEYVDGRHPSRVEFTSSQEDVKRRDFTVNGLLYDPEANQVIDYVGGQEDIKRKVIRTIGEPQRRFEEDKLRLLRAVRFATNLNFEIDKSTFECLVNFAPKIEVVSAERIRDELVKIFTGPRPGHGLELLSASGLLKIILPEVEAMKGVEQPPEFHPEGDVFIHTKIMLDLLENADLVLAFGSLFHDVGKPPTKTISDRIRFNGHPEVGARMTEEILRRLRFSNHEIEDICACVLNHMRFKDVQLMREAKLKRFMTRSTFVTELVMHRADCLASHGILDNWDFLNKEYALFQQEKPRPEPLITGNDLIQMGYAPGPRFKEILTSVEDACLEKKISTAEEALAWVKTYFSL